MSEISALSLGLLGEPPAPRVLVVDTPRSPVSAAFPDALAGLGVDVSHRTIDGADTMIGVQCEKAMVPGDAVVEIVGWLADGVPSTEVVPPRPLVAAGPMSWRGGTLREGEITVGMHGLRGVLGVPDATMTGAQRLPADLTVFLNPGSEHSVGPGRAWVEYARHLNLAGYGTLRLDLRGWGESPLAPDGSFGVSYDPHTEDDIIDAVADLRARGAERIVLVGLCWSSWMALRAVLRSAVEGVYALNASFAWHRGIAPGQNEEESLRENAGLYARVRLGERLHVWPVLDVLGLHSHNTRWLDRLGRTRVPIRLAFAEGDIGLTYLRQRLPRPLQRLIDGGTVTLVEIPGIDHQMHREWLRPVVAADLASFVSSVAAGSEAVAS
jgi:pimeloyl-ACP methyl ester carboxylesterase